MNKLSQWLTNLGNKYKAWKEKEPERQKKRLEKLKRQTRIQIEKESIANSKFRIQEKRLKIMKTKQDSMPDFSMGKDSRSYDTNIIKKEQEALKKAEKEAFGWK